MQANADIRLQLANERNARRQRHAARSRLAEAGRRPASRPALRQRLGRSIVSIGARIAAEPNLTPARSR
jgi:hypothetical protein